MFQMSNEAIKTDFFEYLKSELESSSYKQTEQIFVSTNVIILKLLLGICVIIIFQELGKTRNQ